MALDRILVQTTRSDNRVALSETHPEHPGGYVLVAGKTRNKLDESRRPILDKNRQPETVPNIVEVALTPTVLGKLATGELVRVQEEKPKAGRKKQGAEAKGDDEKAARKKEDAKTEDDGEKPPAKKDAKQDAPGPSGNDEKAAQKK
jgi:hypothetical protein